MGPPAQQTVPNTPELKASPERACSGAHRYPTNTKDSLCMVARAGAPATRQSARQTGTRSRYIHEICHFTVNPQPLPFGPGIIFKIAGAPLDPLPPGVRRIAVAYCRRDLQFWMMKLLQLLLLVPSPGVLDLRPQHIPVCVSHHLLCRIQMGVSEQRQVGIDALQEETPTRAYPKFSVIIALMLKGSLE